MEHTWFIVFKRQRIHGLFISQFTHTHRRIILTNIFIERGPPQSDTPLLIELSQNTVPYQRWLNAIYLQDIRIFHFGRVYKHNEKWIPFSCSKIPNWKGMQVWKEQNRTLWYSFFATFDFDLYLFSNYIDNLFGMQLVAFMKDFRANYGCLTMSKCPCCDACQNHNLKAMWANP